MSTHGYFPHHPRLAFPRHLAADAGLHDRYQSQQDENLVLQIANLRYRVYLIRNMQIFGVLSLLFCVISMFALFAGWIAAGQWTFGVALILMMISMGISLRELQISVGALDLLLSEMGKGR